MGLVLWRCSEPDSDDDSDQTSANKTDVADGTTTNYYVWYAVNLDVSPAEPQDTLDVNCPALVSLFINRTQWFVLF